MRLLAGKIRGVFLDCLRLNFLAGVDLNQAFRGGSILLFGLQPHGAAEHASVVIHRNGGAEATFTLNGIAHLMCVVKVVAAAAYLRLEPPEAAFLPSKQPPF